LAFRVLTGNQQPDHSRISEFRRRDLDALSALFVQILRLCQKAGMVSLGLVALDGTKVKANASKHKAMSHERMLKAEAQLEKEIQELLSEAEIVDAQEDGKYGKGKRGSDLPEELQRREDRLEKIRQARKELEAETAAVAARERLEQAAEAEEAAQKASEEERQKLHTKAERAREKAEAARELAKEKAEQAGLESPNLEPLESDQMPRRGFAHQADGTPTAKTQRNHRCAEGCAYTDPDSHIMKGNGERIQGYHCQAVVDGDHQVIVAVGVSNQPPDVEHLEPMLERTIANTGACPTTFIADAGYWSEENAEICSEAQTDPHIATGRQKQGQPPPATTGRIPKNLDLKGRMARKLRTKKGREIYAKRKTIPEPVFGQTKEARGLRRFLLRGLEKVNGEWTMWCTTHNILKLFRFQKAQVAMATG
jgi:hypothetical protein